jgi:hypothetical protein
MGFESKGFVELWSPSMTIMSGGIESGFNHVKAPGDYAPRLMRIKQAKRKVGEFNREMGESNREMGEFNREMGEFNREMGEFNREGGGCIQQGVQS